MTTTLRKAACVLMLLFAGSAVRSATRLAASALTDDAARAAPQGEEPASARDPDDPKFAGHFSGRVLGPDGKPLGGARIFIVPSKDRIVDIAIKQAGPVRAKTGADGRFEFDAPDMTYADLDNLSARRECLIIATADGYGPDWISVQRRTHWISSADRIKQNEFVFRLAVDDVPIHGRLLGLDGRPLAAARVRVSRLMIPRERDLDAVLDREIKSSIFSTCPDYGRQFYRPDLIPGLVAETRTDDDGRFTFSGLGRERLAALTVSAPRAVDTALIVMTRDAPDVRIMLGLSGPPPDRPAKWIHGAGFTRQLEPGRTITGRVIDRDSRAPVSGMWVGPLVYYGVNSELYPWVTDENGRFAISGLPSSPDKQIVMAFAAPGIPYQSAGVEVEGDAEAVIESRCGIPFRLKVVDESGKPVEAAVTYVDVFPNPDYGRPISDPEYLHLDWPNNPAARMDDGSYQGFVIAGPGAILVKTPGRPDYHPARVDPKAFFAPGRTEWTAKEQTGAYGTQDTLVTSGDVVNQNDYAAIVLVNAKPDSGPLELSATVVRHAPRRVDLVDPDGKPVVGVQTEGVVPPSDGQESPLRAASFTLSKLHPDRARRIKFFKDDRQLIGYLIARGDGDTPYTVRMEPWGTVIGRLVDENGEPFPIEKPESDYKPPPKLWADMPGDPELGDRHYVDADAEGRFRIDKLVPGKRFDGKAYPASWGANQSVFENLVLGPGEVRDLGDVRIKSSYEPQYMQASAADQQATVNIPAEAWGEPVDGLRVAIVLRSPPVDEKDRLRYDIVAENVSDHDIRFGAARSFEFIFYKIELFDADGKPVPRQPGSFPEFTVPASVIRCWLKPKERMVISPCSTKLVRLDATGQPVPASAPDRYNHFVEVKPGRYSVSAAIELGSGVTYDYIAKARKEVLFAPKGEWTGQLRTGVVAAPLFAGAGK